MFTLLLRLNVPEYKLMETLTWLKTLLVCLGKLIIKLSLFELKIGPSYLLAYINDILHNPSSWTKSEHLATVRKHSVHSAGDRVKESQRKIGLRWLSSFKNFSLDRYTQCHMSLTLTHDFLLYEHMNVLQNILCSCFNVHWRIFE